MTSHQGDPPDDVTMEQCVGHSVEQGVEQRDRVEWRHVERHLERRQREQHLREQYAESGIASEETPDVILPEGAAPEQLPARLGVASQGSELSGDSRTVRFPVSGEEIISLWGNR